VKTTRRAFVAVTGASVATTLAGCGGGGGGSSPTAPSAGTPTPAPTATPATTQVRIPLMGVGETTAISVNLVGGLQTPLAVTRLSATEVVAVSRICTHESCTVALPAAAGATLECPCHGSRFRTTGQVVNGPAARPLSTFPAAISGNEVVITIG
jgi:Rieske Fe-S protein